MNLDVLRFPCGSQRDLLAIVPFMRLAVFGTQHLCAACYAFVSPKLSWVCQCATHVNSGDTELVSGVTGVRAVSCVTHISTWVFLWHELVIVGIGFWSLFARQCQFASSMAGSFRIWVD